MPDERSWDKDRKRLGELADLLDVAHGPARHRRRTTATADLYDERTLLFAYWTRRGIGPTELARAARCGDPMRVVGSVRPEQVRRARKCLSVKGIAI